MRFLSYGMRGPCLVHGGGKRALVVNTKLNRWRCWAPECRHDPQLASRDCILLAAKLLKIPVRDAALLQSKVLNRRIDRLPGERELAKVEEKPTYEHECVQAFGFTPEQARALGSGYMPGGTMPKRLLVPIRNREGDTLGFIGLSPDADVKPEDYNE